MYGAPYGYPGPGARVDVNGDGIPDVRVGPYGQVRPDVGTYVHGPAPYGVPPMGYPGTGARLDVDGDGIPDVRVGPYGQVRPDVGTYVHGPAPYGVPPYGYPHYY